MSNPQTPKPFSTVPMPLLNVGLKFPIFVTMVHTGARSTELWKSFVPVTDGSTCPLTNNKTLKKRLSVNWKKNETLKRGHTNDNGFKKSNPTKLNRMKMILCR